MSNPFTGLVSDDFKLIHKNMISALLTSLAVPCVIRYAPILADCPDCEGSGIGDKSSNVSLPGQSVPVHQMGCVACGGDGKKQVETTENINLAVIFDYKKFIPMAGVVKPEGSIQVLTLMSNSDILRRANYLEIDRNISGHREYLCQRNSEFEPAGFENDFCVSLWKPVK